MPLRYQVEHAWGRLDRTPKSCGVGLPYWLLSKEGDNNRNHAKGLIMYYVTQLDVTPLMPVTFYSNQFKTVSLLYLSILIYKSINYVNEITI